MIGRDNPIINAISNELDIDYIAALGLYIIFMDLVKTGDIDRLNDDRFYHAFGFMSRQMYKKLSSKTKDKFIDRLKDIIADGRRDEYRVKQRDYRERKRGSLSSPLPSTPPIPPIIPPEKERENREPPVSQSDTTPKGVRMAGRATRRVFQKPTRDELKAYADEIDYNLNIDSFLDYYDGNGWMTGKNHMKDWKATVRNWKRRDEERGKDTHARREQPGTVELTDEEREIIAELKRKGLTSG